jgi:hypothetical protein
MTGVNREISPLWAVGISITSSSSTIWSPFSSESPGNDSLPGLLVFLFAQHSLGFSQQLKIPLGRCLELLFLLLCGTLPCEHRLCPPSWMWISFCFPLISLWHSLECAKPTVCIGECWASFVCFPSCEGHSSAQSIVQFLKIVASSPLKWFTYYFIKTKTGSHDGFNLKHWFQILCRWSCPPFLPRFSLPSDPLTFKWRWFNL